MGQTRFTSLMLKQILQTIGLCFVALLLTTEMVFAAPFSGGILLAEHTPDHKIVTPVEPAKSTVRPDSAQSTPVESANQINAEPSVSEDSQRQQAESQANSSGPYDPYDYDAIREMNRQIYGEVKD